MSDLNAVQAVTSTVAGVRPVSTWPLFRFAQREFKGRWLLAPALPDAALARLGYRLAGPFRSAAYLDEEERRTLFSLTLRAKDSQDEDERRHESELLARCPFSGPLPPLDVDVVAGTPRDVVEECVSRVHAAFAAAGFGVPDWHSTGGKGFHGDVVAPAGIESVLLLRAAGAKIRSAANDEGVPLLSDHRSKEGRPAVCLDDTLYEREADGRGVVWRLSGSERAEGGRKVRVNFGLADVHTPLADVAASYRRAIRDHASYLCLRENWTDAGLRYESLDAALAEPGEPRVATARINCSSGSRSAAKKFEQTGKLDLPPTTCLTRTASQIVQVDPGRGGRHDLRLALAAWLLGQGIGAPVVAATLAGLGDLSDANDAVRTTQGRLRSGERVRGLAWLRRQLGDVRMDTLRSALRADLQAVGVNVDLRQRLTAEDRQTLRDAAKLATAKWAAYVATLPPGHRDRTKQVGDGGPHATALRRAAKCGFARQRAKCESCSKGGSATWISAENFLCPHCAAKWSDSILRWISERWPDTQADGRAYDLVVGVMKLTDDSYETALRAKREWQAWLPRNSRRHARWILAPGYIAFATRDLMASSCLRAHIAWRELLPMGQDAETASKVLQPVIEARARRLRQFLATKDLESLATDGWVTRVVSTSAGKCVRQDLAWPTKEDLRVDSLVRMKREREQLCYTTDEAKAELRIKPADRRTPCCAAHWVYELLTDDGRVAASRRDFPWKPDEVPQTIAAFLETGQPWDGLPLFDSEDIPAPQDG